jgi:hypothetical protein
MSHKKWKIEDLFAALSILSIRSSIPHWKWIIGNKSSAAFSILTWNSFFHTNWNIEDASRRYHLYSPGAEYPTRNETMSRNFTAADLVLTWSSIFHKK